jgi:opacity protein-like surface antigen
MYKKFFLSFGILLSSIASAQSEKFEGAYYGIGYVAGSTNTKGTDTTTSLYDSNGQSMQVGSVEVGYGYLYKDQIVINTKLTYDITNPVVNSSLDTANRTDTQKNHFSIAIEPGYLLNNNTLIFGKLSYHSNQIHYYRSFISGTYSGQTASATTTFTGYGIGAGVKTEITNNVFLAIDTEVVSYGSKTPHFVRSGGTTSDTNSYKPTSNITTISISKKF